MNLFDGIDSDFKEEHIDVLYRTSSIRIERIISTGHKSPKNFWYDQNEDEWVCLLQGSAVIEYEEERTISLNPGDTVLIPAHQKHRVACTAPNTSSVWLCIFMPVKDTLS
jgi:cupin 2 domain-containing protein